MTDIVVVAIEDQSLVVVEESGNTLTVSSPPTSAVEVQSPGPQGAVGPGVAPGGSVNDILRKAGTTDYDTAWTDAPTLDGVQFDVGASEPPAVGKVSWFADDGTIQVGLAGGNINLSVGQEQLVRIKNTTGQGLTKGQVVAISGAQGQRLTVTLATSTTEVGSSKTFGFVAEPIADQDEGFVATQGLLRGLNTNLYQEGAAIWLGSSPGAFTTTKPVQPNHLVFLGWIARQGSGSSGSVFVHVVNGFEVDELHDVLITSKKDGEAIVYDGLSGLWKNKAPDKSPVFSYTNGLLTRIDYASGSYKLFSYTGSTLTQLQYVLPGRTITKVFAYNIDGTLASIAQTEVYN
jgi:hypothetical protein